MLSVNETKIKAVCAIYLHRRKIIYSLWSQSSRSWIVEGVPDFNLKSRRRQVSECWAAFRASLRILQPETISKPDQPQSQMACKSTRPESGEPLYP